jgi:hypothetical protein
MIAIDRLEQQFETSDKSHKGKIMSGARERATKQYFKDTAARARRKQGKTNYDTFRRDEQLTEEDLRLEDIHFANFLGLPRSEYGIPYNNVHIDEPVNIAECDMYLKPEPSKNVPEEAAPQEEEGDYINTDEYLLQRQIEREETSVAHLDLGYIPETNTITSNGWYFKRTRNEDDIEDEPEAKRIRMTEDDVSLIGSEDDAWGLGWGVEEDDTHIPAPFVTNWEAANTWPAPEWQDNLKFCEERNRQEQEKFVQEHPDEGRLTVECLRRAHANEEAKEEANFAAMVAYMKEQVALAQQMMEDELAPCECCR